MLWLSLLQSKVFNLFKSFGFENHSSEVISPYIQAMLRKAMVIQLQPGLSDEQIIKLHQHYKDEEREHKEQLKKNNPKLFEEMKLFLRTHIKEIFKDNPHLRI